MSVHGIPSSSLFYTPEDTDDLARMVEQLSTPEERAIAYRFSMFAFNLSKKLAMEDEKETA